MLVKRSIVERWYQTDSWVYKNFAYLFDNPLWQKNIPRGFSVCPYFWLNIFSLLIFRPFFVAPIQFVVLPIMRAIGKPAYALDKGLYNLYCKLNWADGSYTTGVGIGMTVLMLIGLCVLAFVGLQGYVGLIKFYPYLTHSTLGMFSFWSIASFATLWGIIALHYKITKTECKTMNYLYVWLILFAIGIAIFIPSEFGEGLSVLFGGVWYLIKAIAALVWFTLCFLGKWIWVGLKWKPLNALYLPWIGYVALLTLVAWLSDKIMSKFEEKKFSTYKAETTEEYWERNRRAWVGLFTRTLMSNDYWHDGKAFQDEDADIYFSLKALYPSKSGTRVDNNLIALAACRAAADYRQAIYKKAFEIYMAGDLDALQKNYPFVNQDAWNDLRKEKDTEYRFGLLKSVGISDIGWEKRYTNHEFRQAIIEACKSPEIKPMLDQMVAEYQAKAEKRFVTKEAKKQSWAHVTCLQVTTALHNGFRRFARGIGWLATNVWTLLVYLWMLIKAKKQGACPYFQFSEPTTKK